MSKNIKIININDIEDVILSKHEIDLKLIEDKVIKQKMTLDEYFSKYATPSNIYIVNGEQIPFNIYKLYDTIYIYICDTDNAKISLLLNKLKLIKYDVNNLVKLSFNDILNMGSLEENDMVIINNSYYK